MLPSRFETSHPVYQLDHFALDYRAEVLAAALLAGDDGQPVPKLGQLLFSPLGPNARPYSRDVVTQPFLPAASSTQTYLRFYTPREGLYDQLPPFLFHPIRPVSGQRDPALDAEQLLEELRQARQVEQQTRLFFLPLDTELYYLRVLRYQHERARDQFEDNHALLEQFAEAWPILRLLDSFLANLFVQLLPFIHRLRGDLVWLSRLLHVFLGVPARFTTDLRITHPPLHEPVLALGRCRLGITAIAGNTLGDTYDGVGLDIGPVPASRVVDFLPTGSGVQVLHQLLGYFLPATAEVVTTIDVAASPNPLAAEELLYLGYNSYL
jgi:hypothetical protein